MIQILRESHTSIGQIVASLFLFFWCALIVPAAAQSESQLAQEPGAGKPSQTKTVWRESNSAVAELKDVQKKIAGVAARNMEACVAISDGVGFGSGVVVSADGLVLTAGHVMSTGDTGRYEVIFPSGLTVPAKPLGRNLNVDSGMLRLVGDGPWPYVDMAGSNAGEKGDWVVSLGHSGGFELGRNPPVRVGRILGKKSDSITTDAILIGGDSGGPLFNLDGQLVAIHSSIGDTIADNKHVPVSTYRRDWKRLLAGEAWGQLPELSEPGESNKKGRMGVKVDREHPRARIKSVGRGTPAEEVGLQPDDIVTQLGNVIIKDGTHLIEVVNRHRAGEVLPLKIERNGEALSFDVQLQ